jgi:hypothetical protein
VRAGDKLRKYTFERYATGCLEHHELVALKSGRDERPDGGSV